MKELLNDAATVVLFLIISFVCGLALGAGVAYHDGYQKGFDKALPLTYASVIKK